MDYRTILPSTSTQLEFSLDRAAWETTQRVPIPLRSMLDPYQCPVSLLPWLAWENNVDIWFDDWPEERKREVIATAYIDHSLKGTLAGIRRYLSLVDVPITYVRRKPRDAYYSRSLTDEEMQRWLDGLPQLRLYQHRKEAAIPEDQGFYSEDMLYGTSLHPGTYYDRSLAPLLMGDVAYVYRDGVETMVSLEGVNRNYEDGEYVDYVTVIMPSVDKGEMVYGDGAYGDAWMTPGEAASANMLTLKFRQGMVSTEVGGHWRSVSASFSDVMGTAPVEPDDFFYGDNFLYGPQDDEGGMYGADMGKLRVYRRIYLTDDSAPVEVAEGGFCYDDFIWAFSSHTAFIGINVEQPAEVDALVYGEDDGYYAKTDTTKLDRAVEAVMRSKRLSDTIILDPITFTPVAFGDKPLMNGTITFGQMIERY